MCANPDQTGVAIFVPDKDKIRVEFYDPEVRAKNDSIVTWDYRIGRSEPGRLIAFWNSKYRREGDFEPFNSILTGIENNDRILFRFSPYFFDHLPNGQTRSIENCHNGRQAVEDFRPLLTEVRNRE